MRYKNYLLMYFKTRNTYGLVEIYLKENIFSTFIN